MTAQHADIAPANGPKIAVLVGGVGGARFLQGVRELLRDADISAIVNVGDDVWMHGLRICPDLDTCMYTLGGGINTERGWGRDGRNLARERRAGGRSTIAQPDWFGLGDRDIATHSDSHRNVARRLSALRGHRSAVQAVATGRETDPGNRRSL